jgi:hypothetical protein
MTIFDVDWLSYYTSDLVKVCDLLWHVSRSMNHFAFGVLTHATILYQMDNPKLETIIDPVCSA